MEIPTPQSKIVWPELIQGTLIKRYKRFLADVKLADNSVVTAHCPNSGAMTTCAEPGRTVYISYNDNPKRKLRYSWELIDMGVSLVGVNTLVPNRLVKLAAETGEIPELHGYHTVKSEVKVNDGKSRIDLLLIGDNVADCFVEVKNCTLVEDRGARFPDAVTTRGLKHLVELQKLVASGHRCVMFYLIQRMDADWFKPAADIDSAYADELQKAVDNGIEVLAYDVHIDLRQITLNKAIPFAFGG